MTADEPEPSTIGETTKKTINRTLVIGAAFTAAVILTPAAFARDNHEPRPSNGIQLATDIVNLVRAVLAPAPAPVIVAPPEPVVTTQTVVVPATKTATVIVTDADTAAIPNYGYILYQDEYIPYYEGWIYHHDLWHWIGSGPRPPALPKWKPQPHHHPAGHPQVVVKPEPHHFPPPAVHHEEPHHEPVPAVRRDIPRREPVRTTVVLPDKKDAPRAGATTTRPEKKDAPRTGATKTARPEKGR